MSTLNAKTSVDKGTLQLQLEGVSIINGTGSVSKSLREGNIYVIQWFVSGVPGTEYSVVIDSPIEARINLTRTLKEDGCDYGGFKFKA